MKTCCNPEHRELNPQVAKFVLDRQSWATWIKSEPKFLCIACAWVWEELGHLDREHYSLDAIEEWEEDQQPDVWVGSRDWPTGEEISNLIDEMYEKEEPNEAEQLRKARVKTLEASDDSRAASFNAGYDDYPESNNPFRLDHSLHMWYEQGQMLAKQNAERQVVWTDFEAGLNAQEMAAEQDEEFYNQTVTCGDCGGQTGPGWSTCTCDDDLKELKAGGLI